MSIWIPEKSESLPTITEEQHVEIGEAAGVIPTMGSRFPHFEEFEPAPNWDLVPSHLREGLGAHIETGREVGGFLRAVLINDLMQAVSKADDVSLAHLAGIVKFLYNYAPSKAFGSPAAVKAWRKSGGLAGKTP